MKIAICYRNPESYGQSNVSHGGLCNNAMWTVKMLRSIGIVCNAVQVWGLADVVKTVAQGYTHCIIEAQFLTLPELQQLVAKFSEVRFVQRNHSQIAFLGTAPGELQLFLSFLSFQDQVHNLEVACNSQSFCDWVEGAYRQSCLYLPNAYMLKRPSLPIPGPAANKDKYKIGCFGAIRILKNIPTSAAAALYLARQLDKQLEFYINTQRAEKGTGVLQSIMTMFAGLNWAKLVQVPWTSFGQFRQIVSGMDLCYQLSTTETFNLVTADACADGVASVVGDAIEWAPRSWRSSLDNPVAAAMKGIELLVNPLAVRDGQDALSDYCAESLSVWQQWLGV